MKNRFTTEQIIRILKQGEAGEKANDIAREHGISEQTYYRWKSKWFQRTLIFRKNVSVFCPRAALCYVQFLELNFITFSSMNYKYTILGC